MGTPNQTFNVRLTPELVEKLKILEETIPELPRSKILRLLIASAMTGSLRDQTERITSQLIRHKQTDMKQRNRLNSVREN